MATNIDDPQVNEQNTFLKIAILIDELRHEDVNVRVNSINHLPLIAKVLGPQRTRDELLPYLLEFLDDDDEILLALAEQLGKLTDLIGGTEYLPSLLIHLENLSLVEEITIRQKAGQSLISLFSLLSTDHLITHIVPLIKRLVQGTWFTSRLSATALFPPLFPLLPENLQNQLVSMFLTLLSDSTPMVRRSAMQYLGPFIRVVKNPTVLTDLLKVFLSSCNDQQDSVRLLIVESSIEFAKVLSEKEKNQHIFPLFKNLATDKSWRVRYMVAQKFCDMFSQFSNNNDIRNEFLDHYTLLLRDVEPEVRSASAYHIGDISHLINNRLIISKLVPPITDLVSDNCQYTRAALASVIIKITHEMNKEEIVQYIVPFILMLLKDCHHDVRLNIISQLDSINQVVGVDLLSQSLLPAINDLATDRQWRVRLAIIKHIPLLATQLGMNFFENKLSSLCVQMLGDPVYTIREASVDSLCKLTVVFGIEWSKNHIIPEIIKLSQHSNYLFRLTSLLAIKLISSLLNQDLNASLLLPIIISMIRDAVPNIRFNVCKTFKFLVQNERFNPNIFKDIRYLLQSLTADNDPDVRFYANEALNVIPS